MTDNGKRTYDEACAYARNNDDRAAKLLSRVLAHWKTAEERLDCIRSTIAESLPKLDEAFRRYGCADHECDIRKCGRSWPCQAKSVLDTARSLRACMESGK